MPQLALAVVGAELGAAAFGTGVVALGLTGAQIGFAVGSLAGGILFAPTVKSQGPRLADLKADTATYGSVIPYVEGHPRIPGIVAWASAKREIPTTSSSGGKGGGAQETTTFSYEQDILYLLTENVCTALRRIFIDGELVWSRADDSDLTSLTDTSERWTRMTFYSGDAAQLPDPTYEAAVGVGHAPAYRTRASVFFEGLQLGTSGQLRNLTFEVVAQGELQAQNPPIFHPTFITNEDDTVPILATTSLIQPTEVSVAPPGVLTLAWTGDRLDIQGGVNYTAAKFTPAGTPIISYTLKFGNWQFSSSGTSDAAIIFNAQHGISEVTVALRMVSGIVHLGTVITQSSTPVFDDHGAISTDWHDLEITLNETGVGNAAIYLDGVLIAEGACFSKMDTLRLGGWVNSSLTVMTSVDIKDVYMYYGLPNDAQVAPLVEPTLQEVVERQCTRAGLDLALVDATALATRNVRALVVSQISSPRQVLEMLMSAYGFTCVESALLRFAWRGAASVATVPYEDLVANGGEALPITKANDAELAAQVFVKYMNVYDDYQDGTESSDRLVSTGQNTTLVEFPLGLTPVEAKRTADFHVTDAVAASLRFGPLALPRSYAAYEPTDVLVLTGHDGTLYPARLTKKSEAAGLLTFEAVADVASTIASVARAATSGYTNSTAVKPPVDTALVLLDIPIIDDADNDAGFYAGVKPVTNVSYPGGALLKSSDNVTFEVVGSTTRIATFGTALTTLGSGPGGVFDEANLLTVDVGFGELSSVTRAALLASKKLNLLAVGAELIQFRSAALVSAGVYLLSGLLRGRFGTEWAIGGHAASEVVVLLDGAIQRVPMSNSELGALRYFKGVTLGRSAASATSQTFTDNGIGLEPQSPVDLRVARDGSANATITCRRRTRLACRYAGPAGISVPIGEDSEIYELQIWNSTYTTLKRTVTASTSAGGLVTFSYSAADQTTDFGSAQAVIYANVAQRSAQVGRGYALVAHG